MVRTCGVLNPPRFPTQAQDDVGIQVLSSKYTGGTENVLAWSVKLGWKSSQIIGLGKESGSMKDTRQEQVSQASQKNYEVGDDVVVVEWIAKWAMMMKLDVEWTVKYA